MEKQDDPQGQEGKASESDAVPATEPSGADQSVPPGRSAESGEERPVLATAASASGVPPGETPREETTAGEETSRLRERQPLPGASESSPQVTGAEDVASPSEPIKGVENGKPPEETATPEELDARVLAESRRHTRRSFAIAAAGAAVGYGLYKWIESGPFDGMQPRLLRRAYQANAAISRAIFEERALAPTYSLNRAENLRVNGVYGLRMALDPKSWRLQVVGVRDAQHHPRFVADVTAWEYLYIDAGSSEDQGHDTKTPPASALTSEKMAPQPMLEQERQRENRRGRMPGGREEAGQSHSTLPLGTGGLLLTMDDILRLPRQELVTQFKCIEGWSQIVHWAGVRMADFLEAYPPALINGKESRFVYMETPDGDYYTGYDMQVCRHPQTLLVTEMMGAPLTQYHGAPLRLHMPTKYGYKQIKRIGLISYTDDKPDDYWTKLGYDWDAGL